MGVKHKKELQAPGGAKKVLLHTCCAPCSGAIIEQLLSNNIEPIIYYSNSNIYPFAEYIVRKNECTKYAKSKGLTIIDDDYSHNDWLCAIKGLETQPERGGRCVKCFQFRLERAAKYANDNGITVLTTTLASSRWKDLGQINTAGHNACAIYPNVIWWEQNWRKGGLQQRRSEIIKEMSFYNQRYCGCEFSITKEVQNINSSYNSGQELQERGDIATNTYNLDNDVCVF